MSFSWSRAGDVAPSAPVKPTVDAKQTVPVLDQLQRVQDAWNPRSPNCAFQHYFYNAVPAEQAQNYVMPPGQDPQRWERAMIARPDPASVPVLAVGFTDLEKRVKLQNEQVNAYRVRMHEIHDKLVELGNRHDLHTTVKLLEMRERHRKLSRRALALAIKIQVLSNRGHVLSPQEELFQRRVREYIQRADDPAVFGSLSEAWARIKSLKSERKSETSSVPSSEKAGVLDWESDREQLELIVKVLTAQQKGITFLSGLIDDDTQKIDEELGIVPKRPKQKQLAATSVAPQSFAAQVPNQSLSQSQPQTVGSLFSMQNPQPAQSQPTTQTAGQLGTGLFGNSQAARGTLGFGNNQATTGTGATNQSQSGGLLGSKPPTGGLFGNTATQSQAGGLFGSSGQPQSGSTVGGGLFGNNQSQPANTGGGIFGNTATVNQTQPGTTNGGLFGNSTNPNQTQPQATGLFGGNPSQNQNSGGSSLFGSSTNSQTQSGGGLFGSTNQAGSSSGLFGNAAQSNTGSSGLFGNNNSQNQNQNQTQSQNQNQSQASGLFGTTSNNNNQAQGGGLFGQNGAQQNQGGGLFGSSTPAQSQSGSGLFGSNQSSQSQTSGGLFGSNNNNQPSGGLFGGNQQSQNQNQSGLFGNKPAGSGLFGQNTNSQAPNTGSLFGQQQPATGNGFGQQPQSGGLFGQSGQAGGFGQQSQNGNGAFGQPTQQGGGLFGQPSGSGLFGRT